VGGAVVPLAIVIVARARHAGSSPMRYTTGAAIRAGAAIAAKPDAAEVCRDVRGEGEPKLDGRVA
jgi:hypothetical protein